MRTPLKSIAKAAFNRQLSILFILFIGGIGVQTITSCSSGGDEPPDGGGGGDKGNDIANYRTKQIGNQVWMAENLNYNVAGSKCYENASANCEKYGRLYDWATAMDLPPNCNSTSCSLQISAKHRGICPFGWHIPSDAEWGALMQFVNPNCSATGKCANASKYLKATSGWNNNGNGEDTYGFSALPGGYHYYDEDHFNGAGYLGYWWGASENNANNAYKRGIDYGDEGGDYDDYNAKSYGYSVRCLQD